MSRIGKKPIEIPNNVSVSDENRVLTFKGPKGALSFKIPDGINYQIDGKVLKFQRNGDDKKVRAKHGLARALVNNIVIGVTNGFIKTLQIEGVGYKAEAKDNKLLLSLGYSHPILFIPPEGVSIETPSATMINISGIDKQVVGEVAAKIRKLRPPEPYKGKGIRYKDEYVRRKAGKSASKK
ncbi:MAG: 50S ribosomal protein L6 [Candidatus Kapaibacteriales bacterium]